ncbi:MAG: hypothetical protein AVO33_08370 [delta proteobacterium ML8_F1]|nr:MAG: hypothetical protein AVO33_08370 [delta proteobacterium ML8_F1]
MNGDRFMTRMPYINSLTTMDYIVGISLMLLLIEGSRRAINNAFTIIVVLFLVYAVFGGPLPGILRHSGQDITTLLETQVFTTSGIFTSPISVSARMVFYFLLFGAFLVATPAGKLFVNISTALTRKSRGGSAKASVVAAALFGMISGSAPANVASIGTIMYPGMKDDKFDHIFSGSMLAIEGTAGQLIPPVMGAAAFIMVDMTGSSYAEVMMAAILPSIVFMVALYMMIHLYALKHGIQPRNEDITQIKKDILKHFHLLLSIVVLVGMILMGFSIMRSAAFASAMLFLISLIRKDTRLNLFKLLDVFEKTARSALVVTMPCALAGMIIGVIVGTGLGMRFSSLINSLAQHNLLIALVATMLMALVLGMGMPTSAAYIMAATLLAPSIVALGVPLLVAHFFVFYFSILSMLTPPVALSSYAAAGIVDADMWKLGLHAFKYSLVIFAIPYIFIYNPALLGYGSFLETIFVLFIAIMGAMAMSIAITGFGFVRTTKFENVILVVVAILVIAPQLIATAVSVGAFAFVMVKQLARKKLLDKTEVI